MEQDEYRKLVEVEDSLWYFHGLHEHFRRALRPEAEMRERADLLDAGCGTGGLLRRLETWHPKWSFRGLDFSPEAVAHARKRCKSPVDEGSVTTLPYPDASFDVIVSADVICQVDHPGAALAEFRRCLRPGGLLLVNVPAFRWLWSYHDDTCQTRHRFKRDELRRLATEAAFAVEAITYWNWMLFPLIVIRRKVLPPPASGSDVGLPPVILNHLFSRLVSLESRWTGAGRRFPWGSSVFLRARKKLADGTETAAA